MIDKIRKYVDSDDFMPIEINSLDDDSFLMTVETLTRIGYVSKSEPNVVQQTCHVLHKKGKYYITHFKHLYLLDGKTTHTKVLTNDMERVKYITRLLSDWNLIKVVDSSKMTPLKNYQVRDIKVIKHSDVDNWTLKPRYVSNYVNENKGNV